MANVAGLLKSKGKRHAEVQDIKRLDSVSMKNMCAKCIIRSMSPEYFHKFIQC